VLLIDYLLAFRAYPGGPIGGGHLLHDHIDGLVVHMRKVRAHRSAKALCLRPIERFGGATAAATANALAEALVSVLLIDCAINRRHLEAFAVAEPPAVTAAGVAAGDRSRGGGGGTTGRGGLAHYPRSLGRIGSVTGDHHP
jgi:hypothetical protein